MLDNDIHNSPDSRKLEAQANKLLRSVKKKKKTRRGKKKKKSDSLKRAQDNKRLQLKKIAEQQRKERAQMFRDFERLIGDN